MKRSPLLPRRVQWNELAEGIDISVDPDVRSSVVRAFLLTGKVFSDPTRIRILAALQSGEMCVCELSDALRITQSTLSTHLQVIRRAGLVRMSRRGKWCYYRIASGAERLVAQLFGFFASEVKNDRQLRADSLQLRKRLALREDGLCCVGFRMGSSTCGRKD